jgi:hypothetical protein
MQQLPVIKPGVQVDAGSFGALIKSPLELGHAVGLNDFQDGVRARLQRQIADVLA